LVHAYNPSTGDAEVEDWEFKAILGYIASKTKINIHIHTEKQKNLLCAKTLHMHYLFLSIE
jgi:hypothetical protein